MLAFISIIISITLAHSKMNSSCPQATTSNLLETDITTVVTVTFTLEDFICSRNLGIEMDDTELEMEIS